MAIAKYNIHIDKGMDSSITLALKDSTNNAINLTGNKAKMCVKTEYDNDKIIDTLSTDNNRISIEGESGTITLIFTHSATMNYPSNTLYYDLILINDTDRNNIIYKKMVEGVILVQETITNV